MVNFGFKHFTSSSGHYVTTNGGMFTVVDTPGFGDTDDMDSQLIDEMV